GRRGLVLQYGLRDVIAVAGTSLVGMVRTHAVAALVEEASGQKAGQAAQPTPPLARLGGKSGLRRLEQGPIKDRLVVAGMHLAAVDHLADVEAVLEQIGQRPHTKG